MPTTLQLDILSAAGDAMTKFLFRSSVAILPENGEVGSGTCVQIDGRYLICTAGHVISSPGAIELVSTLEFTIAKPKKYACKHAMDKATGLDVGMIELSKEEALSLNKNFIETDSLTEDVQGLEKEVLVITGFPSKWVKREAKDYDFGMLAFVTRGKGESEWDQGIDKRVRFELDYPAHLLGIKNSEMKTLPDAPGISGGGVWLTEINSHKLWLPEKAKLIGINSDWDATKRWTRANRVSEWLKLVRS